MTAAPSLLVMAKSPIAGRVKTRCTPPCSPEQGAALAAAALRDTLRVARTVPAATHVLALDGPVGAWLPDGFTVVTQQGHGLGARLDHAFAGVTGPVLMIGMDTPQVTAGLLEHGLDALAAGDEAVVGLAADGGFWAAGLRRPAPGLFASVPMSREDTGERLLAELSARSLRCSVLPVLDDVDDFATAELVASTIPGTAFAATVRLIVGQLATTVAGRP